MEGTNAQGPRCPETGDARLFIVGQVGAADLTEPFCERKLRARPAGE